MLQSSNEALLTFTTELKRIKKVILAAVLTSEESMDSTRINSDHNGGVDSLKAGGGSAGAKGGSSGDPSSLAGGGNAVSTVSAHANNHNMDALLKRLMKFKHLEEDNKKLKNLLK